MNLKFPVTVDGKEIETLDVRRPKVRDMIIADKSGSSDAEKEVVMFGNLCGVDRSVIEELDVMDYQSLQVVYQGFLS